LMPAVRGSSGGQSISTALPEVLEDTVMAGLSTFKMRSASRTAILLMGHLALKPNTLRCLLPSMIPFKHAVVDWNGLTLVLVCQPQALHDRDACLSFQRCTLVDGLSRSSGCPPTDNNTVRSLCLSLVPATLSINGTSRRTACLN